MNGSMLAELSGKLTADSTCQMIQICCAHLEDDVLGMVWSTQCHFNNHNVPQDTPNITAFRTIVLSADASVTSLAAAQTDGVPSVTTQDILLWTVHFPRIPVWELSSTTEILRDSDVIPVVQLFKGGNVMICGRDILFSIIHLPPLSSGSPYTFTVSIMFFADIYQYIIW